MDSETFVEGEGALLVIPGEEIKALRHPDDEEEEREREEWRAGRAALERLEGAKKQEDGPGEPKRVKQSGVKKKDSNEAMAKELGTAIVQAAKEIGKGLSGAKSIIGVGVTSFWQIPWPALDWVISFYAYYATGNTACLFIPSRGAMGILVATLLWKVTKKYWERI